MEKREAKAQAAKRQAESTQKADAKRKNGTEAQAAKRQAESTHVGSRHKERFAKAQAAKCQSETPCLCVPVQKTKYGYVEDVTML